MRLGNKEETVEKASGTNNDYATLGRNNWVFAGPRLSFCICVFKWIHPTYESC